MLDSNMMKKKIIVCFRLVETLYNYSWISFSVWLWGYVSYKNANYTFDYIISWMMQNSIERIAGWIKRQKFLETSIPYMFCLLDTMIGIYNTKYICKKIYICIYMTIHSRMLFRLQQKAS